MTSIVLLAALAIVIGVSAYACCRAAGEADRWYEEHAKDMLPKRRMEETS